MIEGGKIMKRAYDENLMKQSLDTMIFPGEESLCPVYCIIKETGFFARPENLKSGFVSITNTGRILIAEMYFSQRKRYSYGLAYINKLKCKKNIFGQYEINATFLIDNKKNKISLQMAKSVYGGKFPNQSQNVDRMLGILEKYITE